MAVFKAFLKIIWLGVSEIFFPAIGFTIIYLIYAYLSWKFLIFIAISAIVGSIRYIQEQREKGLSKEKKKENEEDLSGNKKEKWTLNQFLITAVEKLLMKKIGKIGFFINIPSIGCDLPAYVTNYFEETDEVSFLIPTSFNIVPPGAGGFSGKIPGKTLIQPFDTEQIFKFTITGGIMVDQQKMNQQLKKTQSVRVAIKTLI